MTVHGIDVSRWQPNVDWAKVKSKGATFAICRAGSIYNGTCYEDTQYAYNKIEAPKHMEAIGWYWYCRPNYNPIKQAEYFAALLKGAPGTIYPVADMEEYGGKSADVVHDWIWVFCDRVYKSFGKKVMIYTSPGFWNARVKRNSWVQEHPLWVAHWNVDAPLLPHDWNTYGKTFTFWQTHVGNDGFEWGVNSNGLDHDVFNGTLAQFREQFVNGQPPEPPPAECPQITRVITTIQYDDGTEVEYVA